MSTDADVFAGARAIADTVLFEGYVLYPYRASAAKNRMRWQFGVLAPPAYAATHAEASATRTEVVVDPGHDDVLGLELRFLHVCRRTVQAARGLGFCDVDRLEAEGAVHVPWDEGMTETVEMHTALSDLLTEPVDRLVQVEGMRRCEPLRERGVVVGRLVRDASPLQVRIGISAQPLDGPYGAVRLRVTVANESVIDDADIPRDVALRSSLVATHTLLGLTTGAFLSSAAPPEWARPDVAACVNEHTWPVLIGGQDRARVVLSSPIILDDDPSIAPESATPLYDSTEIDEILTLRTMTLTEEEKREARGTDARAAAVIDAVDALPPELLDRLHGAIRSLRAIPAEPDVESTVVAGVAVTRGSHVRLRPGTRGADAQDLFLDGRAATVHEVLHDLDGEVHVAVSVDEDPLSEMQTSHGRYRYFRPDELEPLP